MIKFFILLIVKYWVSDQVILKVKKTLLAKLIIWPFNNLTLNQFLLIFFQLQLKVIFSLIIDNFS